MNIDVIEMHSSWLAVNSIIGCSNGCKYCFLQSTNQNLLKPEQLMSPKESINMLLQSKYYDKDIPICLLPNTDPFLNPSNISYLIELLRQIKTNNITNVLTIVTKCLIPDYFINFVKENNLTDQIVIYLSYSGLDRTIEPNVNHENIKTNFEKLSNNNIKIIHYFRPLVPQNSSEEHMRNILNYVKKFTNISVCTGLKLKESYIDKIDFWDEISENRKAALEAEGVWVQEAFDFLYKNYDLDNFVFQTNTCALSMALGKSSIQYYDSYECKNYNICSKSQRQLCRKNKKCLLKSDVVNRIINRLKKIEKYNENIKIKIINNEAVIYGANLLVGDLSYLTYTCGLKVTSYKSSEDEFYFNSSLNGSKPLVLGRKK